MDHSHHLPLVGQPDSAQLGRERSHNQPTPITNNLHSTRRQSKEDAPRAPPPQVDGPGDTRPGGFSNHFSAMAPFQPRNAYVTAAPIAHARGHQTTSLGDALGLLPWCTSDGRLSNEQAIALSDLGGSLKEVMLVALSAAVDEGPKQDIERAVGKAAAGPVIEFWTEEFAVD